MKLKELLIETSIDKLVELVKKKGEISVDDAAKALEISERQITDWASVLEESNILKLVYPAIGKAKLVAIELPPKKIEKKVEEFKKRKKGIEKKAKKYEERVEAVKKELNGSVEHFVGVEKELYKNLKQVEQGLAKLKDADIVKARLMEEITQWEEIKEKILRQSKDIKDTAVKAGIEYGSMKNLLELMDEKMNKALANLEIHRSEIKNLDEWKNAIEGETEALSKEVRIFETLAEKKIEIPIVSDIIKLLSKTEKKKESVEKDGKKIEKRISKVKEKIEKTKKLSEFS